MAKRTIFQCDKCLKTVERNELPTDWIVASTNREEYMWCMACWRDIKSSIPQAAKPEVQ